MSRKALSEFQWVAGGPDRTRSEESSPLGRWWYRYGGPATLTCRVPVALQDATGDEDRPRPDRPCRRIRYRRIGERPKFLFGGWREPPPVFRQLQQL